MFDNIGDKAVQDALSGLHDRIAELENSPIVQSLTTFLNNLNSNGVVIKIGDITISAKGS